MDAALVETHISVVVFVGDQVYKLKKPVQFPFADLSTRAAREAMCHREVELNRRLAPDVYEGVIDMVGPDGAVCDHLVLMRRMPEERRLARLVGERDGRVAPAMVAIAELLARFHAGADRSPEISSAATPEAVVDRWLRNDAQMRPFVGSCFERDDLDRVQHLVEQFVDGRRPLFEERIDDGCICDGHGDLLADDVFLLDDGPRILDCIEFDDQLRHIDVIDDVAFLAMDLERLAAGHLSHALVAAYERAVGIGRPEGSLRLLRGLPGAGPGHGRRAAGVAVRGRRGPGRPSRRRPSAPGAVPAPPRVGDGPHRGRGWPAGHRQDHGRPRDRRAHGLARAAFGRGAQAPDRP